MLAGIGVSPMKTSALPERNSAYDTVSISWIQHVSFSRLAVVWCSTPPAGGVRAGCSTPSTPLDTPSTPSRCELMRQAGQPRVGVCRLEPTRAALSRGGPRPGRGMSSRNRICVFLGIFCDVFHGWRFPQVLHRLRCAVTPRGGPPGPGGVGVFWLLWLPTRVCLLDG
jgi:hypothetical protein